LFLKNKPLVLVNVAFHPDLIPEALMVVDAQRLVNGVRGIGNDRTFSSMLERNRWALEVVQEFFNSHDPRPEAAFVPAPLPLETITPVFRLSYIMDFFIEDFAHHRLQRLDKYSRLAAARFQNGPIPNSSHLFDDYRPSYTEKARLQRALLRLELCSLLFHVKVGGWSILRSRQRAMILSRYSPWEIEELRSVRDYFMTRLREVIKQIEDSYLRHYNVRKREIKNAQKEMEAVKSKIYPASANEPKKHTRFEPCATIQAQSDSTLDSNIHVESLRQEYSAGRTFEYYENDIFRPIDKFLQSVSWETFQKSCGSYFFSNACKIQDHASAIEYMTSLGLDFLHTLLTAKGDTQLTMVHRNARISESFLSNPLEEQYLPQASDAIWFKKVTSTQMHNETVYGLVVFAGDDLSRQNLGWLLSNKFMPTLSHKLRDVALSKTMRSWGYVFWDESTLARVGFTVKT
jgi:hypothetical protein